MAGCELEDGHPSSPVGVEKSLQYSTDGLLQLTYKGALDKPTGNKDAKVSFKITEECSVVNAKV